MTPEHRELLAAEGGRERAHVSRHTYSLAEFGLSADVMCEELADLFERYHWGDEAPPKRR
jgi:hypothetical protein